FLEPLLLINALGAEAGHEGVSTFRLSRSVALSPTLSPRRGRAGEFPINFFDEALLDGFLERDGVEAPAHRIAAFFDVGDDFVENGAGPAMGRNDGNLATPSGDGFGDLIEHAL